MIRSIDIPAFPGTQPESAASEACARVAALTVLSFPMDPFLRDFEKGLRAGEWGEFKYNENVTGAVMSI